MPNLKSVMAGPALSAGGAAPSGGSRPGRAGARPRHSGSGRGRGQAGRAAGGRGWAGFGPPPPPRARRTCHAPPPPPRAHQRAEPRAGRDRDTPPTGGDRPIAGRALCRPWRAAASRPIGIGKGRRRSEKEPSAGGGASRGRRLRGGRRNVNFAGSFVRAAAAGVAGACGFCCGFFVTLSRLRSLLGAVYGRATWNVCPYGVFTAWHDTV